MGSGRWSDDEYTRRATTRATTGTSYFDYSTKIASGKIAAAVHETLDPKSVNKNGPNTDKNIRESCDSDEHPNSLAIAVLFDETGSMMEVPQRLVAKLPDFFGMLLRKGIEDPQVLFGAIGDAFSDRVPLQIGQFESDNRAEDCLGAIYLEGNGGGQQTESYELAMYYMWKHTTIDCYTKRGHRGYLFIIGDEAPYKEVDSRQIEKYTGDKVRENLSTASVVEGLREMYDVYLLRPRNASYVGDTKIIDYWKTLLGPQNVIVLDDEDAVCETLATLVGLGEGIELDEMLHELVGIGASNTTVKAVSTAVAGVGVRSSGVAAKATGALDDL